jgi:hypothetical protein
VLEEARADLRALDRLLAPRLEDPAAPGAPGAAGASGGGDAVLRLYLVRALASLRAVPPDGLVRGDQERAAHLVAGWLCEGGRGVTADRIDGRTFLRMSDPEAARGGVRTLLAEVERLLDGGATTPAAALVERFATRVDRALREEIAIRAAREGIPSHVGCVMPDLIPVRDAGGEVIDARPGPPGDFTLQMLRYSGKLPFEFAAAR